MKKELVHRNPHNMNSYTAEELTQLPVGYVCHHSWGCVPEHGHIECHIGAHTVMITVDQKTNTLHIVGPLIQKINNHSINAVDITFR